MSNYNAELLKFLDESPSRFHAVANLGKMLDEAEQKVVMLRKGADGAPIELPFDAE